MATPATDAGLHGGRLLQVGINGDSSFIEVPAPSSASVFQFFDAVVTTSPITAPFDRVSDTRTVLARGTTLPVAPSPPARSDANESVSDTMGPLVPRLGPGSPRDEMKKARGTRLRRLPLSCPLFRPDSRRGISRTSERDERPGRVRSFSRAGLYCGVSFIRHGGHRRLEL